jgi:hypothetical protein
MPGQRPVDFDNNSLNGNARRFAAAAGFHRDETCGLEFG